MNEQTAPDDVNINFTYIDAAPPAGGTYYYYVKASKAGMSAHTTDYIEVTAKPNIVIGERKLGLFKQTAAASYHQIYTVSGFKLAGPIIIAAPNGYEISNNNTTWYPFPSALSLPPIGDSVPATSIYVRLNSLSPGTYNDSISHISVGADNEYVPVTGTSATGGVLPLHLLSFTATYQGNVVVNSWKTTSETNITEYIIERSDDGRSFKAVGKIASIKTSADNNYSFNDNNPLQGKSYYRLRIVHANGTVTYSNIVSITTSNSNSFSAFPNPAKNSITVSYRRDYTSRKLQVVTIDGKKVIEVTLQPGSSQTTIDISSLKSNQYLLILVDKNQTSTQKILKL